MENSSNSLAEQNIRRFYDQLRSETDARRRAQLQRWLAEEEDRLGFTVERLKDLDQAITDGDKRVELQRMRIDNLEKCGCDITAAMAVLKNMEEIQSTYRQYRLTLLKAVDRNRVLD